MDSGHHILIVDDDPWIQHMVSAILESGGYQVMQAADGEAGLATAKQSKPDLVILDILMPKMDGWQFIQHFRSLPQFAFVPVIFLTSSDSLQNRARAFRIGADDFLTKPFHQEELLYRVKKSVKDSKRLEADLRSKLDSITSITQFNGSLEEIGLASLLTVIEMEKTTGILLLKRTVKEQEEKVKIFLREGAVVDTQFEGAQQLTEQAVIYHVISWKEGDFYFLNCKVDLENKVKSPTLKLLVEGTRRLDEKLD